MTSGQETEWVYSYNPGARTGRVDQQNIEDDYWNQWTNQLRVQHRTLPERSVEFSLALHSTCTVHRQSQSQPSLANILATSEKLS